MAVDVVVMETKMLARMNSCRSKRRVWKEDENLELKRKEEDKENENEEKMNRRWQGRR